MVPFSRLSKQCGLYQTESLQDTIVDSLWLRSIASRVRRISHYFPWKNRCLEQALTIHFLLKKKADHTLYFGMRKSLEGNWEAHAWVRCGETWVIGYQPNQNYTVVGTFASLAPAKSTREVIAASTTEASVNNF